MPARVDLARLLRRVRRRLRLSAAAQGAVLGVCVGLGGWGVLLLTARWGAPRPGGTALLVAAGIVLGAAVIAALRRIPLATCARALDRAVGDGDQGSNGDRTLAALALMDQPGQVAAGNPFIEAAIDDAARAARGAGVATTAAPLRRPRGLGVAAALGAVIIVASLWPVPQAPAAAGPVARASVSRKGVPIQPAALAAERAAAEEAARQAAALKDERLARLAAELSRILDSLAAGSLEQGEALQRLAKLEREAAQAAQAGRPAGEMLRAAADALEREQQTQALAEAMRDLDEAGTKKAAEDLAERTREMSGAQRERLARSLGRAAAAGARSLDRSSGREAQRRLASPEGGGTEGRETSAERAQRDRQLKRLERDLADGADLCRQDPEACKQALAQAGADLPEPARDARQSSMRDKLGRATQQLRERLRRQNPSDSAGRAAEEDFERAAGGVQSVPAGSGESDPEGQEGAQPSPGRSSSAPPSAQAAAETTAGGKAQVTATTGENSDGTGSDPGDDPLGARDPATAGRGQRHQARIRDGEGPSRAEVIESGAHKGFARTEYQRVFQDYSAVVEETLDTTAVPAPRRYLVRRYFQLIRPRETRNAGNPSTPSSSGGGVRGR